MAISFGVCWEIYTIHHNILLLCVTIWKPTFFDFNNEIKRNFNCRFLNKFKKRTEYDKKILKYKNKEYIYWPYFSELAFNKWTEENINDMVELGQILMKTPISARSPKLSNNKPI